MGKQPHLMIDADDVHDLALLPGDPDRVARIADKCEDPQTITENREFALVNAEYDGRPVTICSTGVGSPSAAIAVEELIRSDVSTFLRVGTTGALQATIDIGDHIIATAAAKDEGTSKRYEASTVPAVAHHEVVAGLVDAAETADHPFHVGAIVTDDAFYAETPEYVDAWEAAGLLAVEMEASIIFTLARRNGCRAGAICTVDGNLVKGTQKGETDTDQELPEASDRAVDVAIDTALSAAREL